MANNKAKLDGLKQWKCEKNPLHVLGILRRVKSSIMIDEKKVEYHATQIMLLKNSLDMTAPAPVDVEVAGYVEGLMLTRMTWRCTICGAERSWHPSEDAMMWLNEKFGDR